MKKYISFLFLSVFILVGVLGVEVYAQQKLSSSVVSCMQEAVEKRDTSIISAVNSFSTSLTVSLSKRKDAIKNSWVLETKEARDSARKLAWDEFNKETLEAKSILKTTRSKSWEQFRIDRKACGVGLTDTSAIDTAVLQ